MIKPGFRTRIWRYRDIGNQVPRIARALQMRARRAATGWRSGPSIARSGASGSAAAHAGLVGVPLDVRSTDDFATKVVEQTGPKLVLASRQTEARAGLVCR